MTQKLTLISAVALTAAVGCTTKEKNTEVVLPNFIYILVDDMGVGDLSMLGQTSFSTPHIDKLASEGMLFSNHYSGSTVCAPSRACLMTGKHTGNHLS